MENIFKNLNSGRVNLVLMVFICVIIGAGVLKIAAPVLLPITIAILLAFVLYPLVVGLEKLHIPRIISIVLAVIIIIAGLYGFSMILFSSGRMIISSFPRYESRLTEIYKWLSQFFDLSYNNDLSFIQNLWSQIGIRTQIRSLTFSLSNVFVDFLRNAVMVVLFVAFLLVEATQFSDKLILIFQSRADRIVRIGEDVMRQVTRYLVAKFLISLANGIIFAVCFHFIGLEFAVVWGVIQFLLNFIPTLGSIAAGVSISFFALLQFWPDPGPIILIVVIVLGTNIILGNILDPKIIGDNLGISPIVVLISLVIWGWIWGFAGMVLAVPLMVIIRIICENIAFLRPVSILLGSRKAVRAHKALAADDGKAECGTETEKKD